MRYPIDSTVVLLLKDTGSGCPTLVSTICENCLFPSEDVACHIISIYLSSLAQ